MDSNSRSLAFASCLVFGIALSACGDSDKDKDVPNNPSDPAERTGTPETSGPPVETIPPVAELPVHNATPMDTAHETTPAAAAPATESAVASTTPEANAAAEPPATETAAAAGTAAATADTGAASADGAEVYKTYCQTCHMSGLNGSIKYGDKIRWGKVTAQGKETVYQHALEGIRNMPPKGGFPNLTDAEVKAAVDYIVNGSGGWKG